MTARCTDKSKQTATPPPKITWLSVDSVQLDGIDVGVERTFSPQRSSTYSPKFLHVPLGVGGWPLGRKCSFNTYFHNVRLNWVSTRHSVWNMALIKFVYSKFVYVQKLYKMFIFFTTMTSIDMRKSTLNYYIHKAHRAVIFVIAQLSWIHIYSMPLFSTLSFNSLKTLIIVWNMVPQKLVISTDYITVLLQPGGVCWCERFADGWGTTATTHIPRLRIGERPWEWTRG